ncbi:division plane positioning ATPase MipZ [Ramlibacter sp. MMS24-I3-19]|uniref:ParA family protein n=1 Tax=Ramlibacter sp. MMS24-I3-19 TaxID=3416606 RepID=UPI003D01AAB5
MPVIAVVNRKGGSGKSTLAAHLAVWCARQGHAVMLGDVDRQQSTRSWLRRRDPQLPAIAPWAIDQTNMLRVPAGITHAVLDTPGGLRGFELARLVIAADAILMPVCHSVFDRDSAAACLEELRTLPKVAEGRCRLATVAMRVDGRTRAADILQEWASVHNVPMVAALRETQLYVKCLERGLTLFDLPASQVAADMAQWQGILAWLQPVVAPAEPAPAREPQRLAPTLAAAVRKGPRPEALAPATRPSVLDSWRTLGPKKSAPAAVDEVREPGTSVVPQFLRHA